MRRTIGRVESASARETSRDEQAAASEAELPLPPPPPPPPPPLSEAYRRVPIAFGRDDLLSWIPEWKRDPSPLRIDLLYGPLALAIENAEMLEEVHEARLADGAVILLFGDDLPSSRVERARRELAETLEQMGAPRDLIDNVWEATGNIVASYSIGD